MNDQDNFLDQSLRELGEPEDQFSVRPLRFWARVGLALLLIGYGVAANYYWWFVGPARFNHLSFLLLFVPPGMGVSLLWLILSNRGLNVLIYPTGLLRIQRQQVESFPWQEITSISIKADSGEVMLQHNDAGGLTGCWIHVNVPRLQIWKCSLSLTRVDGRILTLNPSLGRFDELASVVQQKTFHDLWPSYWERFAAGEELHFGPYSVDLKGIKHGYTRLYWWDKAKITLSGNQLQIKRQDKWTSWAKVELESIPNVHLFIALCEESWRLFSDAQKPPASAAEPLQNE